MANYKSGDLVGDGEIYLGRWRPMDRWGNDLEKTFDVFAAREDLTDAAKSKVLFTYLEAKREVASISNLHGHKGSDYADDVALYEAIADGSYQGDWIIPPRDLVRGRNFIRLLGQVKSGLVQRDNLYELQNTGAFKGSLVTEHSPVPPGQKRQCYNYGSCTSGQGMPRSRYVVDFSDGWEDWIDTRDANDVARYRLCRAELVP